MKLKSLGVLHENCAYCEIDGKYVVAGYEDDTDVFIEVKESYIESVNSEEWNPSWESIKPLDKDEITSLFLIYEDATEEIRVPFKNVSPNGSYNYNSHSTEYHIGDSIIINWEK